MLLNEFEDFEDIFHSENPEMVLLEMNLPINVFAAHAHWFPKIYPKIICFHYF
jgi:hypothetical protein